MVIGRRSCAAEASAAFVFEACNARQRDNEIGTAITALQLKLASGFYQQPLTSAAEVCMACSMPRLHCKGDVQPWAIRSARRHLQTPAHMLSFMPSSVGFEATAKTKRDSEIAPEHSDKSARRVRSCFLKLRRRSGWLHSNPFSRRACNDRPKNSCAHEPRTAMEGLKSFEFFAQTEDP